MAQGFLRTAGQARQNFQKTTVTIPDAAYSTSITINNIDFEPTTVFMTTGRIGSSYVDLLYANTTSNAVFAIQGYPSAIVNTTKADVITYDKSKRTVTVDVSGIGMAFAGGHRFTVWLS